MALAHGRACSYLSSENGAASPGRWHPWQFFSRTDATSLVNVTGDGLVAAVDAKASKSPTITGLRCITLLKSTCNRRIGFASHVRLIGIIRIRTGKRSVFRSPFCHDRSLDLTRQ